MGKKQAEKTLSVLQAKGRRLTPTRKALSTIFDSLTEPITVTEILAKLSKVSISVHKTTIYRELETLIDLDLVTEVDFGDGQKRYERRGKHHHHIVCRQCGRVVDVFLHAEFGAIEKKLARQVAYREITHNLEFFGLCDGCL